MSVEESAVQPAIVNMTATSDALELKYDSSVTVSIAQTTITAYNPLTVKSNITIDCNIILGDSLFCVDADADDATADSRTGRVVLGAGSDLNIYHGGTNSYLVNKTGDLIIMTDGSGSGIILDTEDDTLEIKYSGTVGATFSTTGLNLASGDYYSINDTSVLNATTLGSAVVASSLTSVGTLTSLTTSGNVSLNARSELRYADSDSSNYVSFKAPATVMSNVSWTLPSADGSDGEVLTTDGSGTLTWESNSSTATNVSASANNSTDETTYLTFVDGATGTQGIETDTGLTYNPSSGLLTTTSVAGTLTTVAQGNVTSLGTLTTLTVDNVIINGTTIGHTSDTDLMTLTDQDVYIRGDLQVLLPGGTSSTYTNLKIHKSTNGGYGYLEIGGNSTGGAHRDYQIGWDSTLSYLYFGDYGTANGGGTNSKEEQVRFYRDAPEQSLMVNTGELVINEGSNDYDFRVESNGNTHALYVDAGNDRVGIFNSSPSVALDVTGAITSSGIITGSSLVGTLTTAAQANVTSLGTLTTLTVDNVIINGTTIGHTSDTDLITLGDRLVTIAGNLIVSGNSIIANTDSIHIEDSIIVLGNGVTGSPLWDGGFIVNRGSSNNAALFWDESQDRFVSATTTSSGGEADPTITLTAYADTAVKELYAGTTKAIDSSGLAAVAAQTNVTSLGTLTTLTIDNVIINGTTIGHTSDTDLMTLTSGVVTVAGEISVTTLDIGGTNVSATAAELNYLDITTLGTTEASKAVTADASGHVLMPSNKEVKFTDANESIYGDGTNLILKSGGTTYKIPVSDGSSDQVLTTDGSGTLSWADASASTATNITASANNSTDETTYLTFVDGATGTQGIETDTGLTYNPSSGLLTTTSVAGTLTTVAQGNVTSLGTLTTLTVDNVIINGTTIGHTSDTDLMTLTDQDVYIRGDLQVLLPGGTSSTYTNLKIHKSTNGGYGYLEIGGNTTGGGHRDYQIGWDSTLSYLYFGDYGTANGGGTNSSEEQVRFYRDAPEQSLVVNTGELVINEGSNDYDFRAESNGNTHALYVDAGNDRVGILNSSPSVALDVTGAITSSGIITGSSLVGTLTTAAQGNVTSLGTLTTLTVDNVIINGTTIGHTSDTDLMTLTSGVVTVAGEISVTTLDIGGTNVSATAAELNIMDGGTSATSTTLADADRVVVNDGGTMKQVALTDFETYFESSLDTLSNVTSLGTLTTLTVDNVNINGTTIGHTSDTDLITLGDRLVTIAGNLLVSQNLIVSGNTIIAHTDSIHIEDSIIVLGNGVTGSPLWDGGFIVNRGSSNNAALFWDESQDRFVSATTTSSGGEADPTITLTAYADTAVKELYAGTTKAIDSSGLAAVAAQTNITSLGTLTTLTVDNVIINGTTIGHTSDTDLMTLTSGKLTVSGTIHSSNDGETGTTPTISNMAGYFTSNTTDTESIVELRHSNQSQGIGFGFNSINATGLNSNVSLSLNPKGSGTVIIGTGKLDYSGTTITSTGTELNYLDITTLGTTEASKAVTADASGHVLMPSNKEVKFTDANESIYGDGTNLILKSGGTSFKIPTSDGSSDQVLTTNGSGTLSWADASASTATNITASANNSTDETTYLTFVDGAIGTQGIETDTGLTYNPSSGLLTTTSVSASKDGDVTSFFGYAYVGYHNGLSDFGAFGHIDCQSTSGALAFAQNSAGATFVNSAAGEVTQFQIAGYPKGYIAAAGGNGQLNFTGAHKCCCKNTSDETVFRQRIGYIVRSSGQLYNMFKTDTSQNDPTKPQVDESLPLVELTQTTQDTACFGVISGEDITENIDNQGVMSKFSWGGLTVVETPDFDQRVRYKINSVGEGAIMVSNYSASGTQTIANGDYITSSPLEGIGMKQSDDLLHNYTVAKAIQSEDFTSDYTEITYNSVSYRFKLIGCTYHCG
jgi:hypothetical protein